MATPIMQSQVDRQLSDEQKGFLNEIRNGIEKLAWTVALATIAIWLVVIAGAVYGLVAETAWQDRFVTLATQVLLPLYESTAAVVLTYIFGKPIVRTIARRIGIKE